MAQKKVDSKTKDQRRVAKEARTTANKARKAKSLAKRRTNRAFARTGKTKAGTRRAKLRKSGLFFKLRKERKQYEQQQRLDAVVTINGQPQPNLRQAVLYCRQLAEERNINQGEQ